MPQEGFNKLVKKAWTNPYFHNQLMTPETRKDALANFDLNEKEIADILKSTAKKISDLVTDFDPVKRYPIKKS